MTSTPDVRPPARVLVVDDVPEVASIVRRSARSVTSRSVSVVSEVNAARAMELVEREQFDLVISDYRMREVDGLTLLAHAREHHPDGKRVLLTGYAQSIQGSDELKAAGLDGCLEKPMSASALTELLNALLANDAETVAALRRGVEARSRSG